MAALNQIKLVHRFLFILEKLVWIQSDVELSNQEFNHFSQMVLD